MSVNATPADFEEDEVQDWFEDESEDTEEDGGLPREDVAAKYSRSQLRVVRETKDYTLDYLRHALVPGKDLIDVAPTYQRRLRWARKKRSLLIESFLLNIPIPPVFLYEREYNEFEVIDGRQRLESIREFLSNNYSLVGLTYWRELNGKRFNDLPTVLQKGLLRRSLPAVVLLAETKSTEQDEVDVRTILFERLNTGGEKLNPQELRNALHPGPFNELLINLARSDPFTTTWNIPPYDAKEEEEIPAELSKNTLFRTMADVELVLRFFAIRDAVVNDRRGSLRRILDRYMREREEAPPDELQRMRDEFESLLGAWVIALDGEPFRLPNTRRPSRPLYDALMVALSLHPDADLQGSKRAVRKRLDQALADQDKYDVLIGRGNTIDAIKDRVALAEQIILGRPANG